MKKIVLLLVMFSTILLSGCSTTSVTCGEGTIIKDGKCVAPESGTQLPNNDETPSENNTVSCDGITGDIFYEVDFNSLNNSLVDNEPGNEHNANNFVVWGQTDNGTALSQASIESGVLTLNNLIGTQLDNYYETGVGYQFFNFETDKTYTVCTVLEGTSGNTITSELGIYYGYGTKDELLLDGNKQVIIQDFMPTLSTNNNYGQYIVFAGNLSGELKIHSIKIVVND